jgi:hypothetical protein
MNVKFACSFIRIADQARGKVAVQHRAIDDDMILSDSTLQRFTLPEPD